MELFFRLYYLPLVITIDTHPPVSAPMHVGERPTWLNTGDFSYEKYFQDFFSEYF